MALEMVFKFNVILINALGSLIPRLDFIVLTSFMAIGQGSLLSIYYLFRKEFLKQRALYLRIFALIVLALVFHLFVDLLHYSRFVISYPQFYGLTYFFRFAFGPLVYLFILSSTRDDWRLKWSHMFHFLPFLLAHAILLPKYLLSNVVKLEELERKFSIMNVKGLQVKTLILSEELIHFLWFQLQPFIYLVLAMQVLRSFSKKVELTNTYEDKHKLQWLRSVYYGFIIFWFGSFVLNLFVEFNFNYLWVRMVLISVHLIYISFMVWQSSPKFMSSNLKKHESPKFANHETLILLDTILDYMGDKKPYLNQDFSLKVLSEDININQRQLSQIINSHTGKNFNKFINGYRIEEAKRRLCDNAYLHFSIEGIGLEVGFKSKVSFYRVFKETVGVTPKTFQDANKLGEVSNFSLN